MDDMIDNLMKKEFISVWVRDPREHKEDFWHTHVDYEICLHTNSMCFGKKTSCVRRRYKEFVWLRHRLQDNDQLIELPKLPPWNPFFSLSNTYQLTQRMKGLQHFLEIVLKIPSLLSDSRLHLFLQSQLNTVKMDACAQGLTRYSVSQAIQHCDVPRFPFDEESKTYSDSDCESSISSSGLGHSVESSARGEETPSHNPSHNPSHSFATTPTGSELLNCMSLSRSPGNEQDVYS